MGRTEQVFPVLLTIIALYKVLKDDVKASNIIHEVLNILHVL